MVNEKSEYSLSSLWIILWCILALCPCTLGVKGPSLPHNYNRGAIPVGVDEGPLQVWLKIKVNTVSPILSAEMDYRVNIRLSFWWVDQLLNWTQIVGESLDDECDDEREWVTLPGELSSKIWRPDPEIINAKISLIKQFGTSKMEMVRVGVVSNRILWTMIMNATVACPMDFTFYPLDIQYCPFTIQSYKYDSSLVEFKWVEEEAPFQVNPVRLIQFQVLPPLDVEETVAYSLVQGANLSQVIGTFVFQRMAGSHLVQTFIPLSLIVLLSSFSFWLELDVTAARGSLIMISMLTLVTHFGAIRSELPPVAYVKAIDIWIFASLLWIFSAMAIFILAKVVYAVTEDTRRDNEVYVLRSSRPPFQSTPFFVTPSRPNCRSDHHKDRTEVDGESWSKILWLWNEVGVHRETKGLWAPHNQSYRKKRLGSVVLSGRSIATLHLPLLTKRVWRQNIPLVWQSGPGEEKTALYRRIDHFSKWFFPLSYILFCAAYWTLLLLLPRS